MNATGSRDGEQRKFPRRSLKLAIIVGQDQQRLTAQLANITVEGMAFRVDRRLAAGTKVLLQISDNETLSENELAATILRCEPCAVNPAFSYLVAVELVDPNDVYVMDALAFVNGPETK